MAEREIVFKVTKQRYFEKMGIDTALHLLESTDRAIYDNMIQFVVDEKGEYLPEAEARKLFVDVKYGEFTTYVTRFLEAVNDAFVNPTKESGSKQPADPLSEGNPSE